MISFDAVVVVERDLVAVDLADRADGWPRKHQRDVVAQEPGLDAGRVDRRSARAGRGFQALAVRRARTPSGLISVVEVVVTMLTPAARMRS